MTNPYTPEKVAELVADARQVIRGHEGPYSTWIEELADVLTAVSAERDQAVTVGERILADALKVSAERDHLRRFDWLKQNNRVQAERDRLHKAITEALATAPKLGELRWRNVDRMIGVLRAALDKEGQPNDK